MLHLLKLEWLKQKEFTIFRVMTILFLVALPSMMLVFKSINVSEGALPPMIPTVESFFMFPNIWVILGYIGNWLAFFFLGFMAVLMVTNEYSSKTMRQNIITGLSRKDYFLSKLYFIVAVSLCASVYYTVCSLAFGFIHTDTIYLNTVLKNADYSYRFFLMCIGYMSFGMFIGLLVKRTGIALFIYLVYVMILELILRYGIYSNLFKHHSMRFYPMNSIEDLAPIPFLEFVNEFTSKEGFNLLMTPEQAIGFSLIYIGLFFSVSYFKLQKGDL